MPRSTPLSVASAEVVAKVAGAAIGAVPLFPTDAPSVAVSSTAIEADDIVLDVDHESSSGEPPALRPFTGRVFTRRKRPRSSSSGAPPSERARSASAATSDDGPPSSSEVDGSSEAASPVPATPAWTEEERALLSEWAEARGYGNPLSVVWRPPQLPAHKIDAFRCSPRHSQGSQPRTHTHCAHRAHAARSLHAKQLYIEAEIDAYMFEIEVMHPPAPAAARSRVVEHRARHPAAAEDGAAAPAPAAGYDSAGEAARPEEVVEEEEEEEEEDEETVAQTTKKVAAIVVNEATPNPTTTAAVTREERRARRARS